MRHNIPFFFSAFTLLFFCIVSLQAKAGVPLRAAAGKIEITPAIGDSVYCMKPTKATVESIHDPIYARILVLSQGNLEVVIVTLDLLFLHDEGAHILDSCIREHSKSKHVLLHVTHTHSGFFVMEQLSQMGERIGKEILSLRKQLTPVSVAFTTTMIDEVYNRRMVSETGEVKMLWQNSKRISSPAYDSSLTVIGFKNSNNNYVSAFIDYTAHPVITMNFDKVEVSADYPGALTRTIDSTFHCTSLFALGAAGDLNPYDAGTSPENGSFDKSATLGKKLAKKMIEASQHVEITYPSPHLLFEQKTISITFKEKSYPVTLYLLALTPELAMVALPGELFSQLGVSIKEKSPFQHTVVMGYTGGTTIGYIPTTKAAKEGGYGAEDVPVGPGTGEYLVEEALLLLQKGKSNYK